MTSTLEPGANPYVGPRTFTYEQRTLFFGREREARDLLARVSSTRLLLFYAQSGAGKSSLLYTRLIPGLRDEAGFAVMPVGRVAGALASGADGPDNIFVFNLLTSLDQGGGDPAQLARLTLIDFLAGLVSDDGLTWRYEPALAEPAAGGAYTAQRYVLIVDQFEEIITTNPGRWAERERFFRQLNDALAADPNLWVVLTLREDYLAALDPYAQLMADKLSGRFYMERMGIDAALDAIQQPAELGGRPFAPGVAQQLVDNLRQVRVPGQSEPQLGQYVEPVQLQVVCYQLWENLQGRPLGPITTGDLQEAGDVDSALAAFYATAVAQVLNTPQLGVSERSLRTWFSTRLITPAGTRGMLFRNEQTGETEGLPNAVVDVLARQFLLRSEARAGSTWVELVHDRFVEPILAANRVWLAHNLNAVTVAAQEWEAAGEPPARLLSGSALATALQALEKTPGEFDELDRRYLTASEKAAQQAAARRQRLITLATAGLLVVFIALAGVALWNAWQANQQRGIAEANAVKAAQQQHIARDNASRAAWERNVAEAAATEAAVAMQTAEDYAVKAAQAEAEALAAKADVERLTRGIRADQLTAKALNLRDEHPVRSLLLAVEGLRAQNDFTATHVIAEIAAPADSAAVTPEVMVRDAVVASAQNSVHELLAQPWGMPLIGHEDAVTALAFSPDGRWLATGSQDSTARLWDVTHLQAQPIVLAGHEGSVWDVAFSPDGRWLATGSQDNTARLWDVADAQAQPIVLASHEDRVIALAFSPDGRWLATGSQDDTARLWDVTDAQAQPIILAGHESAVNALAFSPDGRRLATGSNDNTARLWDVTDPQADPIVLAGHESGVWDVAFSPDGRWLATGSQDNTARLWDVSNPQADPIVLAGHEGPVADVAFSPDGRWLATGSNDNTARLWDVSDAQAEPIVLAGHEDRVIALAFSPDGRWLATGSNDNTARLWDVADVQAQPIVLAGHEGYVTALAFSPDGRWLATGSNDNTARLWDVTDAQAEPSVLAGHEGYVTALAFSPDGRWLATGSWDNTARLWDVTDPQADPIVLAGHEGSVNAVAFSPDGRWLATGSQDSTARLWDVTHLQAQPIVLAGHEGSVWDVAFSPDGRWLATGSQDNTARLWDVTDAQAQPIILAGHESDVYDMAFSPDGRRLATGSQDDTARLWDVTDAQAQPIILAGHESGVNALAFSPDGRWLATGSSDNTARLWDVTDPQADPIVLAGHESGVWDVAFSPDGRWLATGSKDNTARLWDVSNPQAEPVVLAGHEGPVADVAFSPDGRWLATGSQDDTARLWDVTDPQAEPVVLAGHESFVWDVAFSPDGRWLATGSADNTARLWTLQIDDLVELACGLVTRNLDLTEWRNYLGDMRYHPTCPQRPLPAGLVEPYQEQLQAFIQAGDAARAAAAYQEALAKIVDPAVDVRPLISQTVASLLVEQGRSVAGEGKVDEAIRLFEQALTYDPTLAIVPGLDANLQAARGLAQSGIFTGAMTAFVVVQTISPTLDITMALSADEWNYICWDGSLAGAASVVLTACERAVARDQDNGEILDSRGLARTLTGDFEGAIADFEAAIRWAEETGYRVEFIEERKAWVADLKAGKNPFDAATLEKLRNP